jgi:DNA (cytosine-5)-methyltransferase 1
MTIQIPPREVLSNPPPLRVLDLFSGIGGFSLGLERAGMETAAFCEIDPKCRRRLSLLWPEIKIHDDVKQLDGRQYAGAIDVICGGYPCQPFSAAGKQQGEADPRHLWPEMHRIIRQACPRWVIAENVRGHVSLGFDTVASQLEDDGFTVWPFIIPASAVGAPHRRDRIWILAHHSGDGRGTGWPGRSDSGCPWELERTLQIVGNSAGSGLPHRGRTQMADSREEKPKYERPGGALGGLSNMANTLCHHVQGRQQPDQEERQEPSERQTGLCGGAREASSQWAVEPDVGRVAHGVPDRVDRLRMLGNAVVPQIPEFIGRTIIAYERQLATAA